MEVLAVDDPMVDERRLAAELGEGDRVRTAAVESESDLIDAAGGADALVVDVATPVTASALDALPDLDVVARAGVGVDNVDVAAAAERDVVVTNVPEYCEDEVATHAVALTLACVRRLGQLDRDVRAGGWDWASGGQIHRVPGSTLGLVSYGPIARRVADRFDGFDVDRIAYDPYVDAAEMDADGVAKVDLDELLDRSDLVVVLAPLTEATRGLIDADALDRLSDDAVLVNVGRGGVVDERALADALADGGVAAAGVDVFETEPPGDSPLLDSERAILTPHAGWYSEEAKEDLVAAVAGNLRAVRNGEAPPNAIDPDVDWV